MRELRQSTAIDLPIGPFTDNADGFSPEIALTITQPDIRLKKVGGAWAQKSGVQTLTHEEFGWYEVSLSATDTDTVGCLTLSVYEVGALIAWDHFMVLTQAAYDAKYSTGTIAVDVTKWLGATVGAADTAGYPKVTIKDGTGQGEILTTAGKVDGVILADTCTTNTDMRGTNSAALASVCTEGRLAELDAANLPADVDSLKARTPAALVGGRMDSSVGAMAASVVTATAIAADAIGASELAADAAAKIADQVWDEVLAGHLVAGSTGASLNASGAQGDPWTTALPGAYGAGTAGKIVGDNVNATIGSRATQTSVDAVKVDTAAVKVKTDFLPSAAAGAIGGVIVGVAATDGPGGTVAVNRVNSISGFTNEGTAQLQSTIHGQLANVDEVAGTPLTTSIAGMLKTFHETRLPTARCAKIDNADIATSTRASQASVDATKVDTGAIKTRTELALPAIAPDTAGGLPVGVAVDSQGVDGVVIGVKGSKWVYSGSMTTFEAQLKQNAKLAMTTTTEVAPLANSIWERVFRIVTRAELALPAVAPTVSGGLPTLAQEAGSPGGTLTVGNVATAYKLAQAQVSINTIDAVLGTIFTDTNALDARLTDARALKLDNLDAAVTTRATPVQVNAEVVDAINVDPYAEFANIPPYPWTPRQMMQIAAMDAINPEQASATLKTKFKANGIDALATAMISRESGVTKVGILS